MPEIAQDFGSYSRRIKGRISGYATLDTTQKTSRKTSKNGDLFVSESLRNGDEITSSTMHHSFRSPLPDLKS
ncbi:MAG: hypothetical protein ACNY01_09215, partial [Desulfobacteria bacterium]